jgi:hypothetical protein
MLRRVMRRLRDTCEPRRVDDLLSAPKADIRCEDCGGTAALPVAEDTDLLLLELRQFLQRHERCALAVTIDLQRD